MNNPKKETNNIFMKEQLPESCHVCLIYDNDEQRKQIVAEYLAAGIKSKEIVRYFRDKTKSDEIYTWLSEFGINYQDAEAHGSFKIAEAVKNYCPGGYFEPEEVITSMVQRYQIAKEAGYSGSRASGEMSWALTVIPGSDRFLEYEALLNTITESFPHTGMCQYDARLFDGVTLLKVLQVHPFIMAKGQVVHNPYYIKPENILSELKKNKKH
jgi:hypothetical protein